jgi:hypothetical protein
VLSIARFATGRERPAYATLCLLDHPPVRWEVATFGDGPIGSAEDDETPGYPVDTGIGCFMDADAARVFAQRMRNDVEYHMVITRGMDASDPTDRGWGWGTVSLEPDTAANIVFFTAGDGDGDYASYFGYDANDIVVCLTTDFALL